MRNEIWSERVDLFEPNIYISFRVQITGRPEADALLEAVKTAFTMNEAAMSRIMLEEDGTAYFEKLSESGCSATVTKKDWLTLITENEKVPFRINKGELMRVFINLSGEEAELLIMAHHLAGDGKSVVYFLEDVMKALAGEKSEYKSLRLITKDSFPKCAKLPCFFKLYAESFNKKWRQSGRIFSWEDYAKVHENYWKERSSKVIYETFLPEETENLKRYAKSVGVSLNSCLTTAFLKANQENGCIGMPVDARQDGNRAMSNQATGISVDYTYSEKLTFDENVKIVHRKVQRKLKNPVNRYFILQFMPLFEPALVDSVLMHTYNLFENDTTAKLASVLGYKGGKTRELGITNLTRLDIPDSYGQYGIKEVLFIPPVVSYAKHIIGVVTTADGMRISYHFMSDGNEAEEHAFFERAIKTLKDYLCSL